MDSEADDWTEVVERVEPLTCLETSELTQITSSFVSVGCFFDLPVTSRFVRFLRMRFFICRIDVRLGTFMTNSTSSWLINVHLRTIELELREVSGMLLSSDISNTNNRIKWLSQTISLNSKHDMIWPYIQNHLDPLLMFLLNITGFISQNSARCRFRSYFFCVLFLYARNYSLLFSLYLCKNP